ncbi:MAG: ABC transporter permease subunit [Clostridia bacterium]|nr:ABC transporter [Oscillospiraceae bacterium]MBQ7032547.1 ABC transporter permease subunit [Clostridia bacterium]
MKAIFYREIKAYFSTPVGYIFIGMFLAVSGYFFAASNLLPKLPDLGSVLSNMLMMFLFLIPVLTMRLLSEEKNSRTDQLLLTAPVSVRDIVLGKFFAATAIYLLTLGITLLYLLVIGIHGAPSYGKIFCNYLGFVLIGFAFISVGLFISSLTQNQASAAIATFASLLFLYAVEWVRGSVQSKLILAIIDCLSITKWYNEFELGVLSVPAVIYYISFTAVFLLCTIHAVDRRRWS